MCHMGLNGKARAKSCYLGMSYTCDISVSTQGDGVHVYTTKDAEPIPGDGYCGLRPGIKGSLWGPLLTFSLQDPV